MDQLQRREPMLNVPPIVVVLVGAIVMVHVVRAWLPQAADQWLVDALGFIPLRYISAVEEWPGGLASAVLSPVTHFLVHGDIVHLVINATMLLAFGGLLARRMGPIRLVLFTAVCAVAGAGLFLLSNIGQPATMIGASGGISGLMAGALRLIFSVLDQVPPGAAGDVLRQVPERIEVQPLGQALSQSRLRTAAIVWTLVNLLAAFGLGTPPDAGAVAWEAHIGGFFAGLLLFGLFDRRPAGGSGAEA
jgi:membrane associated rhomboid family serine protease